MIRFPQTCGHVVYQLSAFWSVDGDCDNVEMLKKKRFKQWYFFKTMSSNPKWHPNTNNTDWSRRNGKIFREPLRLAMMWLNKTMQRLYCITLVIKFGNIIVVCVFVDVWDKWLVYRWQCPLLVWRVFLKYTVTLSPDVLFPDLSCLHCLRWLCSYFSFPFFFQSVLLHTWSGKHIIFDN